MPEFYQLAGCAVPRERNQTLHFFGLDATWEYGMRFPFNFIGRTVCALQIHFSKPKKLTIYGQKRHGRQLLFLICKAVLSMHP
jgi:hypothetical protein